jgi:hypothetical protein
VASAATPRPNGRSTNALCQRDGVHDALCRRDGVADAHVPG